MDNVETSILALFPKSVPDVLQHLIISYILLERGTRLVKPYCFAFVFNKQWNEERTTIFYDIWSLTWPNYLNQNTCTNRITSLEQNAREQRLLFEENKTETTWMDNKRNMWNIRSVPICKKYMKKEAEYFKRCVWCQVNYCEDCAKPWIELLGLVGDWNHSTKQQGLCWPYFGVASPTNWRYNQLRVCALCYEWRCKQTDWNFILNMWNKKKTCMDNLKKSILLLLPRHIPDVIQNLIVSYMLLERGTRLVQPSNIAIVFGRRWNKYKTNILYNAWILDTGEITNVCINSINSTFARNHGMQLLLSDKLSEGICSISSLEQNYDCWYISSVPFPDTTCTEETNNGGQCMWCLAKYCENCTLKWKQVLGVAGDRNHLKREHGYFRFISPSISGRLRVCTLCYELNRNQSNWNDVVETFQNTK